MPPLQMFYGNLAQLGKKVIFRKKRISSQFNFTYRYIDDVLSIYNPDFENDLGTTESNTSASYLDLLLLIGRDG